MSLMIACDAMAQSDATGGAAARVEVSLDGEIYSVRASAQLAADQRVVWETLTDYERLREFIPGVTRARVLARTGNQLSIEQVGVFSVLFIDLPVRVRLAVQHLPYTMVLARMDASPLDAGEPTLRSFSGRYTLSVVRLAQRAGVRLDYDAQFELTRPLPVVIGPLFGVAAVRGTMRAQFEAMLREIERRQALLVAAEQAE
ncbi:MAG TPA: SRPBCC family protein [Accumulibacter sp.]|nr:MULTISPECIES: SRPBCC family protein [Candidatus Accumulibacter]MCM8620935.1 SRPBCC family protein [Accumulibacter sp.]HNF91781.1 SRPBCC family protein [Accumulibacter sp.]